MSTSPPAVCLTIAGSDPSGGAGLQADLKTFHAHGVYGASVVTLLTVQDTRGVSAVEVLDPDLVEAQLRTVLDDLRPAAIKTGALGSAAVVERVARILGEHDASAVPAPAVVVDPVMVSKHGHALVANDAVAAIRERLLPLATIVTPNVHELARLVGADAAGEAAAPADEDAMTRAGRALLELGAHAALVKSPAGGIAGRSVDLLVTGAGVRRLDAPRIDTTSLHGSGCATAAAVTARLARGAPLEDAVAGAKAWITRAIANAPAIGHGTGPLDLLPSTDAPCP